MKIKSRILISLALLLLIGCFNVEAQESQVTNDSIHAGNDWIFYVFILVFLLLGVSRVFYAKSFLDSFRSFKNINVAHQNFKTQNLKLFFVDVSMVLIFILLFSLLVFTILDQAYQWDRELEPTWYVVICLLSVLGFGLKLFANKILTEILPFKENLNFSNFIFWSGIKMIGILLIPIVLFSIYNPFVSIELWGFWILITTSSFFYVIYIMRLFKIGKDYIYKSNLHFFLYICASEIAPLFVILKFSFLIINKLQQVFI